MTYYSTVTSKGTITLPAEMRKKLHAKPGVKLAIEYVNNQVVVRPAVDLDALRAKARECMRKQGIAPVTDDQITDAFAQAAIERYQRSLQ